MPRASPAERSASEAVRRRFGPWLSIVVLAGLIAAAVAWLRSPARHRPATLPDDATIVDEDAYADGSYDIHLRSRRGAFERWVASMGMEEVEPEDDGAVRHWRGPDENGCRIGAYFIAELQIGDWGRACGDPDEPLFAPGEGVDVHVLPLEP